MPGLSSFRDYTLVTVPEDKEKKNSLKLKRVNKLL